MINLILSTSLNYCNFTFFKSVTETESPYKSYEIVNKYSILILKNASVHK